MPEIKNFPNNQDEYRGAEAVMRWLYGRTSGVFGAAGNAAVSAFQTPRMAVKVSDGTGWLADQNGLGCVWWIDNNASGGSPLALAIDAANAVYNRIDRVIVEWNTPNYTDWPVVRVLKGTFATKAVAPALTNDSTTRQISLARIYIKAGATGISAADITDERLDEAVCGLVTDRVNVDTKTINAQVMALVNELRTKLSEVEAQTYYASKEYVDTAKAEANAYTDTAVRKAAPRNILDNSDFTNLVAKAGIGGNHGTVAYAADRWILDSGTVSYEAGVGLTLNGTIRQKLEFPPTGETSAFVGMASGTASISYADGAVTITSSGGVIKWAALYGGVYSAATMPDYQPKGYGAELAECQRYFWRMNNNNGWGVFALGWEQSSTNIRYIVMVPVQMRIKPSVAYAGDFCVTIGTKDTSEVTKMSIDSFSGTYIQLSVAIPTQSIVKYRLSKLSGYNDSTAHIDFIADL